MNESYFAKYPLYLKATDIMEIMQYSKTKAYSFINELSTVQGIVFKKGKSIRIHRDRFFKYVTESEGMTVPA